MSRNICLFAQYEPRGTLPVHVRHLLRQIQECGFRVVMACSGHDTVPDEVAAFCDANSITVVARANGGLDFGAWQHLIQQGYARGDGALLFANDSVFGPLRPLAPLISSLADADVWGLVDSQEVHWHLQSWFFGLSRAAFERPAIQRVFAMPFAGMERAEIVFHGEIGLGVAIRAEGLRVEVAQTSRTGRLSSVFPVNPMHVHWRTSITSGRVPFLKVEVLRDNAQRIAWLKTWPEAILDTSFFAPQWIETHLAGLNAKESPPPSIATQLLRGAISQDSGSLGATLKELLKARR
ncbi:hypothetical protein AA103196_0766 [Ameyamaea chiangmaiensis NBRC 103196]|uniref:Uncharacterized protein n=1 Tax=Ameyamaea chiangmaiensis TaxID=442969 RepID=A0A850PGC8_9PROT|nr:rhamnan synthesis F family protein [Ameyamaea chiangmaiensis]MBS4075869.1 hypothetical protein [Ameyamaea chiangmaiensis]NVN40942.1 hypothetical protein [Ameyamaea chiangmaiensis]GBQ64037.1 hypothetical protein AA103196_0766 [Ameyamaea chiangmaiensis NBRC 103196]